MQQPRAGITGTEGRGMSCSGRRSREGAAVDARLAQHKDMFKPCGGGARDDDGDDG